MKGLKVYTITGIICVSILGTLLHFAYNFSGNNFIVGLLVPINESVWEHTKLLFFPMLVYSLYMDKKIKDYYPCVLSAMSLGAFSGVFLIIVLFYTYSGITGFNITLVDIAIFYISTAISFYIAYKWALFCKIDKYNILLQILNIVMICLFITFTLFPPDIPLFVAP